MRYVKVENLELGDVIEYGGYSHKVVAFHIRKVGILEDNLWAEMTLKNTYNGEVFIADMRAERNVKVMI